MTPLSSLSAEVLSYIEEHKHTDIATILLGKNPFADVSSRLLADQILGRRIAERKFPFLLSYLQYRYPTKTSLEQSSSQWTADYKASLIPAGRSVCDLTGGMGVDTLALSKAARDCTYVEQNEALCLLEVHNFQILEATIQVVNSSAEEYLATSTRDHHDWLYIDPSRRVDGNKKTSISNLQPNLLEIQEQMLELAACLLVKLSPMQDISEVIRTLIGVREVHIVSLQHEVKEILVLQQKDYTGEVQIVAVDLSPEAAPVVLAASQEAVRESCHTGPVQHYLYQPPPAVVKGSLHDHQASGYGLHKVHANTQLYTSASLQEAYPGRIFEVLDQVQMQQKAVRKVLPAMKANIISKNHPLSPAQIAKKLSVREGGEEYLIAVTDHSEKKLLLHCKRIH